MNAKDRQKSVIVDAINKASRQNKNKPITVAFDNMNFSGISSAKRYNNNNMDSYSDIIVSPKNSKDISISLKSKNISSSSENSFREIDSILPGISSKFLNAAYDKLVSMKLNPGDTVPEIYGTISKGMKEDIVIGSRIVGGPIDYVYENSSSIRSNYDDESNVLKINGYLVSAKEYANDRELYLLLKPKRPDQKFDPESKYGGVPRIYGDSLRGDDDVIIEITENISRNAITVKV